MEQTERDKAEEQRELMKAMEEVSAQVRSESGGKKQRVSISRTDYCQLVPPGCRATIAPASFHKLAFASYVCVRIGGEYLVRYFLRLELKGSRTNLLLSDGHSVIRVSNGALIGEVIAFQTREMEEPEDLPPVNILLKPWYWLTDCGATPFFKGIAGKSSAIVSADTAKEHYRQYLMESSQE